MQSVSLMDLCICCACFHRERKTMVVTDSKESSGQHVIERPESAEAASLPRVCDLSAGGNCQSYSWYRSNLTPLHLAASVIVHVRLVLPVRTRCVVVCLCLWLRAFGSLCRAHGGPAGVGRPLASTGARCWISPAALSLHRLQQRAKERMIFLGGFNL